MQRQPTDVAIPLFLLYCLPSILNAQGVSRQCYELNNGSVCYFRPQNDVAKNWDDADRFCRENNATLPVIPDIHYQRTIEMYLSRDSRAFVFTAARKSWSLQPNSAWRWVNGKQSQTAPAGVAPDDKNFGCIRFDVPMVRSGVSACSSRLGTFICRYPERNCRTLGKPTYQLHDKSQCFVIYDDDLGWYYARNKCIESGGDLATFEDIDHLTAFRNFTSAANGASYQHDGHLVGLQRKWWTWRDTEPFDVRYSNWPPQGRFNYLPEDHSGSDCLCLKGSNNFQWASCKCTDARSVICQSGSEVVLDRKDIEERTNSNSQTDRFSNVSRCYDADGTQVCYFTPQTATRLSFTSASQWCRSNKATLPIIRNLGDQRNLESFLGTISLPIYLLWTAGVKVKTGVWSWINGKSFQEYDVGDLPQLVSFHLRSRSKETFEQKGQLQRNQWSSFSFDRKSSANNTGYICQIPVTDCKIFASAIRTKSDDCLMVNEQQMSWYKARDKCIEYKGDLTTLEDDSKIAEITSLLTPGKSYHVGLENSRWIWYRSDNFEEFIQYNNWNESLREHSARDLDTESTCQLPGSHGVCGAGELENRYFCLCIETFTYKWIPCECDFAFRFVCQRVESKMSSEPSLQTKTTDSQNEMLGIQYTCGLIIAGVEGLVIAALFISTVSLAICLRKRGKAAENAQLEMQLRSDKGFAGVGRSIPSQYQDLKIYEEVH